MSAEPGAGQSPIKQQAIQRAVRAACKAGMPPTKAECHPDGRIILCFGETKVSDEDALDLEMERWRRDGANA